MKHLTPGLKRLHGISWNDFQLKVPPEVSKEDILNPPFWAHYVEEFRVDDEISILAIDGSFDMRVRVIDKQTGFIKFRVLRDTQCEQSAIKYSKEELAARAEAGEKKHSDDPLPCIKFHKGLGAWYLLGYDGKIVRSDFKLKSDADRALAEYITRAAA